LKSRSKRPRRSRVDLPRPCPLLTPHVVAAYLAGRLHRAVFANDGPTPAVRTSLLIAIVVAVTLMN
jgi:hypothetical protein